MRFQQENIHPEFIGVTFEVDQDTYFTEQSVAISALGAYDETLRDTEEALPVALMAANLGRLAAPKDGEAPSTSSKPKELLADLTPQKAATLVEALLYYAEITDADIINSRNMRNYKAVSTRRVEKKMALDMAAQLEKQFELVRASKPAKKPFGFARALFEDS